jgi:hypothetical protein
MLRHSIPLRETGARHLYRECAVVVTAVAGRSTTGTCKDIRLEIAERREMVQDTGISGGGRTVAVPDGDGGNPDVLILHGNGNNSQQVANCRAGISCSQCAGPTRGGYNLPVDIPVRSQANIVKALQIYFKVPVEIRKKNGRYVASCFLLDIVQEGANKQETLAALTDAVQLFVTACCGSRELDEMLRRHDLRLPEVGDEMVTGHYIDVAVALKIPKLNKN